MKTKGRASNISSSKKRSSGNQHDLHKGIAKIHKGEKVFKRKPPRPERSVTIDHKTTLFVSANDPRKDEDIRKSYLERENKKLKNLK